MAKKQRESSSGEGMMALRMESVKTVLLMGMPCIGVKVTHWSCTREKEEGDSELVI